MNKKEKELILNLIYTPYEYRDNLGLKESETFGLEIEYEMGVKRIIKYLLTRNHLGWNEVDEDELTVLNRFGGEVISPVLMDSYETWTTLVDVLKCIRISGGTATSNTGGHIHFDRSFLNDNIEDYIYMLKCWCVFESIIEKIACGSFSRIRPIAKYMASSFTKNMLENKKDIEILIDKRNDLEFKELLYMLRSVLKDCKCNSISLYGIENPYNMFSNNTFEVRIPNGTLNPVIWQNNVNFFAKFLRYFKTDYDKELINYYYNLLNDKEYNEFTMALLLGSLIFDKDSEGNFNYLRQYVRLMK